MADNFQRFRINPVEVVIFMAISLVSINSAFSLFSDRGNGIQATALAPMAANPISEGRAPASLTKAFDNITLDCAADAKEPDTSAPRIRLAGKLCGDQGVLKTQIINQSNKSVAVVFTDVSRGTFSTDYIPLNSGKNAIHIEFVYQNGKQTAQDFIVNRL